MSTSSDSPSANSSRSTPPSPWTCLRRLVQMDAHAQRFDLRTSIREPASSTCRGMSRGRIRRRAFPAPDRSAALAASSPSSPPPITAQRFDCLGIGDDLFQVFDRAIDEHARLVDARHRRHERKGTRGQHARVVRDLDALVGANQPLRRDRSSRPDRRCAVRRRSRVPLAAAPASASRRRDGRRTTSAPRGRTPPAALRRT